MLNRPNVVLKKGYIPDTFADIEEKEFVFVNLDMDLYAPTLAALRFFKDKMTKRAVIIVHDYFNKLLTGVKKAVKEFAEEADISLIPIGDSYSIAVIQNF
ncbi:hypothetical protein AGMMS49975_00330 [Clostridia bacterium]|nr:hypothetical protein AGMMS49975_00330 [Clostridia bacterium]